MLGESGGGEGMDDLEEKKPKEKKGGVARMWGGKEKKRGEGLGKWREWNRVRLVGGGFFWGGFLGLLAVGEKRREKLRGEGMEKKKREEMPPGVGE